MGLPHAFALVLVPTLASAQAIEVPGDFATIQAALDAAPSDAVIVVHGGTWESIRIEKPVTLIGAPAPFLAGADEGATSPIVLAGPGSGRVTLTRLHTGGFVPDFLAPSRLAPALQGSGFDELHVLDCELVNNERSTFTGLGLGNSAVNTDVPFVLIERSLVRGSRSDIDDACTSASSSWIPPAGIHTNGTVVVLDSEVHGGDVGRFNFNGWPNAGDCDVGSCPAFPGGVGVQCAELIHAGSILEGGRGARWFTCSIFDRILCCEAAPGAPFVVSTEDALANTLTSDGPLLLGRTNTLHLATSGPTATLLLGLGLHPPVTVPGLGRRFLDGTSTSLGALATPGDFGLRLPLDPGLVGTELALQLLDPVTGYSRPLASILRPAAASGADTPTRSRSRSL